MKYGSELKKRPPPIGLTTAHCCVDMYVLVEK